MIIACVICRSDFYIRPYRSGVAKFCSSKCRNVSLRKRHTFTCVKCGASGTSKDFYKDNYKHRGYVARCKSCYRDTAKADRLLPRRRFSEHKTNAVRRGISWNLTLEEYCTWIWGAPCCFCGEPANGGMDRMNNDPYYSVQNVLSCCARCNSMKEKDSFHNFLGRILKISENLGLVANQAIACEMPESGVGHATSAR